MTLTSTVSRHDEYLCKIDSLCDEVYVCRKRIGSIMEFITKCSNDILRSKSISDAWIVAAKMAEVVEDLDERAWNDVSDIEDGFKIKEG